jgi:hypothetical protein
MFQADVAIVVSLKMAIVGAILARSNLRCRRDILTPPCLLRDMEYPPIFIVQAVN